MNALRHKSTRIPYRIVKGHARVRLFCLPFAGGSAVAFRDWPRALPDWIDVCPVELPGRGVRFGEDLVTSMDALIDDLLIGIRPLADQPIALFGYSMGARIARELARALGHRVVHVFASASPAPHATPPRKRAQLSVDDIVAELHRLGGTPGEVFSQHELLELLLPIVRADFAVLDGYNGRVDPPIDCPITVLAGTADPEVPVAATHAWQQHTTVPCKIVQIEGGHFFLESKQRQVLQTITEGLAAFERPYLQRQA